MRALVVAMLVCAVACGSSEDDAFPHAQCILPCLQQADFRAFLAEHIFGDVTFDGCPDLKQLCVCDHLEGLTCQCGSPTTCRVTFQKAQFESVQILGAVPVKKQTTEQGESWVPACSGDAEAVQINFNMKSTARIDGDKDTQIRPGEDIVGGTMLRVGDNIGTDDVVVDISCAGSHSGSDNAGACNGRAGVAVEVDDLVFVDHLGGGRGTPIGVAILIDHTGSTIGAVEGTRLPGAFRPTCLEAKPGSVKLPERLDDCTHSKGLRLTTAEDLVATLNESDSATVFAFNEEVGVKPVCKLSGRDNSGEAAQPGSCHTTDGSSALARDLLATGRGRSNLWTAVDEVFALTADEPERARHLIVIADGPDTCHPGNTDFQFCFDTNGPTAQAPCPGAVSFESARQSILAYLQTRRANKLPNDVHVTFIHYQTYGYPETDPRMQEIACLTGGQYLFLNTNTLAENSGFVRQAFSEAVRKVRLSLGGHWAVVANVPALVDDSMPIAPARGQVLALEGSLTLGPIKNVASIDKVVNFGFGNGGADKRLPIVKACRHNADCGADAGTTCGVRCDSDTHTCNSPASGSPCGGSETSVCCQGACTETSGAQTGLCTAPQPACP